MYFGAKFVSETFSLSETITFQFRDTYVDVSLTKSEKMNNVVRKFSS